MLKIKVFGYRGPHNNTEVIESELRSLGCNIENDPDLLIHLNGTFEDAERYYTDCVKKPVRLYVLLDIDATKSVNWYNQVKNDLENCEIPCVISETVKKQVKKILNIKKDVQILNHPIKPVSNLKEIKGIPFLYSGRIYSKNKRFDLVLQTMDELGYDRETLVVVGTEDPPLKCLYVNSPNDNELNQLFNAADFLLSPSEFEGQNCNMIQAVITRTFPILNNQCEVVKEFGLQKFSANPDSVSMARKIREIQLNSKYYLDIMNELRPVFLNKFSSQTVVKNILELYWDYKERN